MCVHGFTDTWRTWELILPSLERCHTVLAPTLIGHAGGPPLTGEPSDHAALDAIELAMDEAGFETAHVVGNSLGGYLALKLAERGRADSVVALAPAGGLGEAGTSRSGTLSATSRRWTSWFAPPRRTRIRSLPPPRADASPRK